MIDAVDRELQEWATRVLDDTQDVDITLTLPGNSDAARPGKGVSIFLLDLFNAPAPRGGDRPPLQFLLRYLISAWAEQPAEAHRLLGKLAFAALERPDMVVEMHPTPVDTWLALRTALQPSFTVRVNIRQSRLQELWPPVRSTLRIEASPTAVLYGVIISPQNVPLADMSVEVPSLRTTTRTDSHGRFRVTVKEGVDSTPIVVRGKGKERTAAVDHYGTENDPIVIRFDPTEG